MLINVFFRKFWEGELLSMFFIVIIIKFLSFLFLKTSLILPILILIYYLEIYIIH